MYRCPQADILHPVSHTQSQACQKQHWSRGATYWCALLARVGRQRNTLLLHVRASQESAEPTKSVLNPDLETRGARRRSQRSQLLCRGRHRAQVQSQRSRPPTSCGCRLPPLEEGLTRSCRRWSCSPACRPAQNRLPLSPLQLLPASDRPLVTKSGNIASHVRRSVHPWAGAGPTPSLAVTFYASPTAKPH